MREQTRAAMEAPKARKADAIPNRRVFMMGNGKAVPPGASGEFCRSVALGCLDGDAPDRCDFALGFTACFDAVARGTIDLEEHPVKVALQAYSDVHDITNKTNKVTDIMRELGE